MKKLALVVVLISSFSAWAQVSKVGNDTLLDVVCWNVEWFGSTSNGPSNEALQYTNVKTVIQNTDMDVWGLCEVSDNTTFTTLLSELPTYDGVNSTFSATQKMALVWKKSMFDLISFQTIADAPSFEFASRRPLEVVLKTKGNNIIDTMYFYVVHLKANDNSSDEASYNRRKASMEWLKSYVEQFRNGKKVVVMGDYNDDVDQSVITIGGLQAATPFSAFVNDSARYFFPSRRLSLLGLTSYPNFNPPNMIDHILNTRNLSDSFYVVNSSNTMAQLPTQITGYLNNTSDHLPVYALYNLKRYPKSSVGFEEQSSPITFAVYPNPAKHQITIEPDEQILTVSIMNLVGKELIISNENNIQISELPQGIYIVKVETQKGYGFQRLVIE